MMVMEVRATRRRVRRVEMPTMIASRRLGGADLVMLAVEEARSTEGVVGKKMRKSITLPQSCSQYTMPIPPERPRDEKQHT